MLAFYSISRTHFYYDSWSDGTKFYYNLNDRLSLFYKLELVKYMRIV